MLDERVVGTQYWVAKCSSLIEYQSEVEHNIFPFQLLITPMTRMDIRLYDC